MSKTKEGPRVCVECGRLNVQTRLVPFIGDSHIEQIVGHTNEDGEECPATGEPLRTWSDR